MIYLASPYSDPRASVRRDRYEAVCKHAASMMRTGLVVYSPIAHSHGIALYGLPTDWDYWRRVDEEMMGCCSRVVVLKLDGWHESTGVAGEIEIASSLGLPVSYVDVEED